VNLIQSLADFDGNTCGGKEHFKEFATPCEKNAEEILPALPLLRILLGDDSVVIPSGVVICVRQPSEFRSPTSCEKSGISFSVAFSCLEILFANDSTVAKTVSQCRLADAIGQEIAPLDKTQASVRFHLVLLGKICRQSKSRCPRE
jgi:hypothetical protein